MGTVIFGGSSCYFDSIYSRCIFKYAYRFKRHISGGTFFFSGWNTTFCAMRHLFYIRKPKIF